MKEAFEKFIIDKCGSTTEASLKCEWYKEIWQAACEYKQKEIDELRLEYDKLTDWASEYKAENAKLKAIIMLAAEASCYTEYEDACNVARRCLKELEEK